MDSLFVPCLNNSVLISLNSRSSHKKIRMKSYEKLPKVVMISPPPTTTIKQRPVNKTMISVKSVSSKRAMPKRVQGTLEFNVNADLGIDGLKDLLSKIVESELKSLKILEERCNIVGDMIKVVESSSFFREKDAADLVKLLNQMAHTVIKTSETEIELGIKNRLCEKKTIELSNLKNNYELLYKRSIQTNSELKEVKEKLKILQEENAKLVKINENERHRFSEAISRTQTLEETL